MRLTREDIGIWLINLPRSEERRLRMERQLHAMGLDYIKFNAVDGRAQESELAPFVDIPGFWRKMSRHPLPGEIGCYFSHVNVWQELAESDYSAALVLEDDVVFHEDFLDAVDIALENIDKWDMLKLNRIRAKVPVETGKIGPYSLNAYLGPATGFGAYLITRDLARKLVPHMTPMSMPIDYEATRWWHYDFKLLGLEPFPSHVDDKGYSTINGSNYAGLVKPPKHKRLRNYAMRGGNYFHRLAAMLRRKGAFRQNAQSGSA